MNIGDQTISPTNLRDIETFENRFELERMLPAQTIYGVFQASAARYGERSALSLVLTGDADETARRVSYRDLLEGITRSANLFAVLAGPEAGVAYLLPSLIETYFVLWGAETSGYAVPVNPLLTAEHILELVQSSGAKILVTVGPGINAQIWEKSVHVKQSLPDVVLVCISAPANPEVECISFEAGLAQHRGDALAFERRNLPDSIVAYFHTGGTTGLPKLVAHTNRNQICAAFGFVALMGLRETDWVGNDWPKMFEALARHGSPGRSSPAQPAASVPPAHAAPAPAEPVETSAEREGEMPGPIDPIMFDRRPELEGMGSELKAKLVELFVQDIGMRLEDLRDAVQRADLPAVARIAHAIKGSAANLGARQLAQLCADIETRAGTVEFDVTSECLDELQREFTRDCAALTANRNENRTIRGLIAEDAAVSRTILKSKVAAAFFRMSRSALSLATSFLSAAISARSARCWPWPGNAVVGAAASSRIQRRKTLSARSRSRATWATDTPRSVTSFTASVLNSPPNFRLVMSSLRFLGHDLILVSTKPAAAQSGQPQSQYCSANTTDNLAG